MRIAFITGCLEPGKDGVGDYTRTLAGACARLGHEVCLLSIGEADDFADKGEAENIRRLRRTQWQAGGGSEAGRWLKAFRPDWVSLQFVPYSLDPRGFFGASIPALVRTLGGASRRHIFFHEVWIGSQRGAAWKARAIGWRQRRAVARMLHAVQPTCVQTSNEYYQAALATLRCTASVLPMFGSVPRPQVEVKREAIAGVPDEALVCGMFGTLHPNWQPDSFFADFTTQAKKAGRPAALVAAGGLGYGAGFFAELAARWRDSIACVAAGRCDEARLARLFARFDFAVTSVPWNILGKSSSAAALREHGLRVIVTEKGVPPRFPAPPLVAAPGGDDGYVLYFRERTNWTGIWEKTPPREGVEVAVRRLVATLNDFA